MGNRQTHLNISDNNSVPINSLCNETQTNDLRLNRNKKMGKKDRHNTKSVLTIVYAFYLILKH